MDKLINVLQCEFFLNDGDMNTLSRNQIPLSWTNTLCNRRKECFYKSGTTILEQINNSKF